MPIGTEAAARRPSQDSVTFEVLSWRPRAFVMPDVLRPAQCRGLIELALLDLHEVAHVEGDDGVTVAKPWVRSCSTRVFIDDDDQPLDDPLVREVDDRLARLARLPVQYGEPLCVIRYEAGQGVAPHYDVPEHGSKTRPSEREYPGQRVLTTIVYLHAPARGGETVFPRTQMVVPVVPGAALLFHLTLPDGRMDRLAMHGCRWVEEGTKWIAMKWWRTQPVTDF